MSIYRNLELVQWCVYTPQSSNQGLNSFVHKQHFVLKICVKKDLGEERRKEKKKKEERISLYRRKEKKRRERKGK